MIYRVIPCSLIGAALVFSGCAAPTSEPESAAPETAALDLTTANVSKVTLRSKGGMTAPVVPGSTCTPANDTFAVVLATRELSWSLCKAAAPRTPFTLEKGKTTLTNAQLTNVKRALNAVRRVTTPHAACIADAPLNTITLTTRTSEQTYLDDVYFCDASDSKAYASGIGAAIQAVRQYVTRTVPAAIVPADASEITVTAKGGYVREPAPGSTCTPVDDTHTVAVATRTVSWKLCRSDNGAPAAFVTGVKQLSAGEYAPIATALSAVKKAAVDAPCGADKPYLTLSVKTPRGVSSYADDFYRCNGGSVAYVSGLSPVESALLNVSDPR